MNVWDSESYKKDVSGDGLWSKMGQVTRNSCSVYTSGPCEGADPANGKGSAPLNRKCL